MSVIDAPLLYVPDEKSGPDHREKNPGQHRPDHAKQPKELYEEECACFALIALVSDPQPIYPTSPDAESLRKDRPFGHLGQRQTALRVGQEAVEAAS